MGKSNLLYRHDLWNICQQHGPVYNQLYIGYACFHSIMTLSSTFITESRNLLETLSRKDVQDLLLKAAKAPWHESLITNSNEEYYQSKHPELQLLILRFIESAGNRLNLIELKRWIRVAWNVLENNMYDDRLECAFSCLLKILEQPHATDNVYKSLSELIGVRNYPNSFREEIIKAYLIINHPDQDWEVALISAEKHPFFRGSIGCILYPNLPTSVEAFLHRFKIISAMFDGNGITPAFRKHHLLIRTILSQLNSTGKIGVQEDGSIHLFITENDNSFHSLKSLLVEKEPIRNFFNYLVDFKSENLIIEKLVEILSMDIIFENTLKSDVIYRKMCKVFDRLLKDEHLYNFITDGEDFTHIMKLSLEDSDYVICREGSLYGKIFINSERNKIIPVLIDYYGFSMVEENQNKSYLKYGDYFGDNVYLQKRVTPNKRFYINFFKSNTILFSLFDPADEILQFYTDTVIENGRAILCKMNYETSNDSLQIIIEKIGEIEKAISKYHS